jgi:DNA-directed RNA polymerase specialized sigma subunit
MATRAPKILVERLGKRASERDRNIVSQAWKADQIAEKIHSFTGLPKDELRDAALEYIVRIYDTWDSSKGANFSTWVNRCLQFHMMNYLRDNSRLIKIPRSYSDLYLKIRKFILKNPDVSDQEISNSMDVPVKKVQAVRQAFAMSFSQINEYSSIIESEIDTEISLDDFMFSYKDILFKISELNEKDETFLVDYLIKKRSTSTLLRKNPHLKNAEDIKTYSGKLIEDILCEKSS